MALSIGILGLPNVGKSSLFKALTNNPVDISNYPFCTIEPNVGIVEVPDDRLEKLAGVQKPEKIVPSVIKFVDVAGLVKGAAEGEGLGNQFLSHLRECEALLEVVRCFKEENISHIEGDVNPLRDIELIKTELILRDLETIEKRIQKIEKEAKQGKKEAKEELAKLSLLKEKLSNNELALNYKEGLEHLFLITAKPLMYLLNCAGGDVSSEVVSKLERENSPWLAINVKEELDKLEFSPQERKELGIEASCLDVLVKKCYKMLDLITFFTVVGNKEARAWSIKKGSSILEGAEMIHSDFKKRFITAEVLNWQKVVEVGSWKKCKELGLLKRVGKDYILKEGDVIEIKHS
jgi:hypothetical protein